MFELEGKKQENLVVRLGIPAVYGGVDVNDMFKDNPRTKPEDVFTTEQLDRWARDNGYVKFY